MCVAKVALSIIPRVTEKVSLKALGEGGELKSSKKWGGGRFTFTFFAA